MQVTIDENKILTEIIERDGSLHEKIKQKVEEQLIDKVVDELESEFMKQDWYSNNAKTVEDRVLVKSTTEGARDLNVKETPSTAKPKRGRPTEIKRDITKTSQSGLREGLTRATFIIREDTLDKLKERAYTDRKKLKDLVSEALDYYLDNYKETK